MINKEYAKKVYNGLVKRGYTSEDLGDEAKFVERMGKETNRRYLYDLVNKRGDANLGTFEGFEKRMGVTSKPEAGGIVGPMPFDAGIPSTPQTQSAQQPISNFGEGVAQGADALYQGGKNAVAEYSNIITGSQRDAQLGLDILSARSEGVIPEFDVNSELDAYNKSEYEKRLKDIEDRRAAATSTTAGRWKQLATDLFVGREEDNLRRENLSVADYLHRKRAFEAIEQALKDSAGDVEKAKKLLAERAKIESWGDAKGREAREAMSQHRPTEGAAWVGEMIPQMAGTAAGLAASLHPATRPLAGVLGKSNLLGLTISSMGSQMAEARNDGASEGDVFKAGALNAAVEAGSEYVPFSRYFGRLVKNTGDVIGRVVGESLEHSPRAKKELQDLLKKGSKELGKLFTGKNAMEFAKDITEEAASEFVAEFGNALIPLIYSNPELYPTLLQAVENGWEGAKGGLFMGTFLGSGSKLASYYAHDKRRKQQGFVVLAETSDGDVVEYAGKDENGNAVVIDGNGEQLTIDSDELGEAVRVSYNEFKTGERGAFRDRMEESFNDGKSAQTKEDKEYIGLSYEYALRRLEELSGLSAEDIKNGFPNAVAVYEAADDAVKANNIEYAKALNDYANAWARLEGSNNAIEEVVEQQSAASDAEVDALSDNGVMRPATLRSGEEVFVVGGNIAVDNNGGIVYEESDAQIVVNVNGERKVVGIAEIGAVGETVNSEEEKISRRGRIESDINNKHNSDINGWKELIPGESYNVLFDGTPFELMVVGRNENGELLISGDGGKSTEPISEADFQNSIREYELRQITVAELNERFAGKLKVLNAMLANIRSEGNEDKAAANFSEVENMVAELDGELPDGYRVVAENGNYVIADALLSANENEARAEGNEGEKGLNGEKGAEGNGQQPNVVQEPVLSPAEQRKQKRAEVAKRIPTEGKKRLWTKAKPEDVAEYISLLESDPAKQAAMVDGYLAEIAEKQAKLSPIEAAELNEDVEFWNGVKGLLGAQTENVARENNDVSKTEGVEAEVVEPAENVSAPAVEDVRATNEMQPAEELSGEANEMVGTVPETSVFGNAEVESASQTVGETSNGSTISQESEQVAEQEKVAEKEKESERVERIEDVGEKIGGAKKDKLRETIDRMKADMEQSDETLIDKIAKLPISKIFNFDFQKLREGGMPNEAISFMEIVKESIPAKPRTSHKVRRWVNNTLALYKLCLEVGTNWDRVNTILTSRDFAGTDLKAQFDAYMSIGGFDSGLNIGNAKLKQLDKTAGYYKDGKFVSSEGKWYVRDAGKHGGIYDTKEEAVEALKAFAGDNAGTTESGKKKEVKFAVYQRREDKSIFIAIKGKSDIVIQDGFKSAKEAFDYIEANNAELQSRYRNLLDKTNTDFEENRERKGRDYRNGKDISAEEFRTTFGFRGVEFGNWMTQEDRRKAINECYDALMDLAAVCRVSPKALSLNGTLGMAFGSRGGGKFSAHYEPGKVVINLTKTRGAGTLAHEWFHAMDNYFAKMGETEFGYATGGEGMLPKGIQKYGKRYYDRSSGRVITEEEYNELAKEHTVRREMVDAWEHLMESLKNSDYYKRSNAYARLHNSKYWNDPTELGARAFSVWVENELSKQDTSNDYLANNPRYVKSEVTDAQDKYMPYPFDTDADWMDEAFGNLFEVMQERETKDGNVALYQRGSLFLDTDNPAFEAATKNTVEAVKKAGVEVEEATPEMVQAMNELAEMQKRKSLETALPEDETSFKGTVVSSDNGAKILKDLDSAIERYENRANSTKTFIGDVGKVLNAKKYGSKSEYADFVTANGISVRIRLADHNATVSNFDYHEIDNGISIVISRADNSGITNNGNAHLVEFFYSDKKLKSADGKPLVEILKSIKQALYSGEYKDNTGLAQREEVNIPEFLRTSDGTIYGWAVNGKIFLTPEGMNPNTPAHEYTHLWASMIEKNDPNLWSRIVEVMKESPTWNEVLLDEAYRDIHNNDSRMASEVLSRLSGEENYRRAMELAEREIKAADGIIEKAKKIALWGRIKQALADFWASVKGVFGFKDKAPWTEFVDMALGDLYAGVNPNAVGSPLERMFIGEDQIFIEENLGVSASEGKEILPKSEYNADEKVDKSESVVRDMDLSDGPVREPGEPEWKFKARREKWRRWVNSFVSTKDPVPEKPFQGADETDEEYRERLKAFNKGLKEWKKQVTKTDAGIDEMMEALYNGKSPEQTPEEEFTENVFRRYMGRDGGIEISKKGMRGIIRDEIIERRRLIETNNFEDVLFVNKVKDATTPEERKIIPFIIEGTYNGEVSPELAAVVKSVKDWFETVYQMLQAADAMHSSGKIKNYVTHIWDKERTPKKVYENYINTRSKYTNKRSIETYAEGIALGMVPKYDDVCDIMLEYGHIANEAVANKKFIDFLHELTVDGEPVLIDAKKSNPLYKKTTSEALEGYKVHKYVSGIVNTVLGSVRTPDVPEWASGIAHFYDIAGAFMKKVNLSLSFFHHGALIETAVGAQGPIKAGKTLFKNIIWDSIRTGKAPALANPEASRRAVNHLVQLGATSDYLAKDVQRLTGRLKKFAEELRDKNPNMLTDGAENVATFIDFLNYGFDEVLWTYLHDGLKIYAFDKYAKEIDEYCAKKELDETDKDMLLNEAGQFVNDTFGGQFWELLDISPVMQKWLRRGLLSPDWTLSTIRQALSPFGFGTLYKDYEDKWYQRLLGGRGDKTDSSVFGRLMNMTEGVKLRRRLGVSFWTMAALTFIPAMNLLNAWRRDDDEEDELEKAKEKRKVDPNYKSPYELKYPNGMKWYDYTMVGNTLGHKTHLFGGRYDDGKEMYIRWGKQFRELPELFLGKDGFVFPGPMIDKLVGKVNPAAHAVLDFAGFSKDGWENVYMKDKIGWEKELGRVMSLVVRCMPYSIPFDEDKEFALTDLMMPSSKGYSRYKALRHFEEAIKSQDMDFVGEVYNACVINKLDAEKLLKAALSRVEAEAKSEYVEGVETLNDAFEAYPVSDVERKRSIRKKMLRLLEENRYKDFERADAEELVLKALRGDGDKASVSLPDVYLRMETPEDVVDDYKIKSIKMALAKVYKEWKGIEDIGARAEYERKHTKQLGLRGELNEVDRKIAEQKRAMSENTKYADAYMNIIRETRREFIERADNLGETVSQME